MPPTSPDPTVTLGHLLSKPYFSDLATEPPWRASHSEAAALVLRKKLARAQTEAVLTGTREPDQILRARRGKWESTTATAVNPEPLRVNNKSVTSAIVACERNSKTAISLSIWTGLEELRELEVRTYTPSGAPRRPHLGVGERESCLQASERGRERRVRFSEGTGESMQRGVCG